jgi:hypothetical protein
MGSEHEDPVGRGEPGSGTTETFSPSEIMQIIAFEVNALWRDQRLTAEVTVMEGSAVDADLSELTFYAKDEVGRCLAALTLSFAQRFLRLPRSEGGDRVD